MKKFLLILILISNYSFSQQKIFQNQIDAAKLSDKEKLSQDLASTFLKTDYYSQNNFYLFQDLIINLSNNIEIKAIYQSSITYNSGGFSAIYKVLNADHAQLVFSEYDNAITGMYQSEDNKKYVFQQTRNGVFAVSEVNGTSFTDKEKALDYIEAYDATNENKILANSNVCLATTPVCAGNTTIDLMVVYTPIAKNLWGSNATANSNITTSITNMNVALTNSGITNISFRLVHVAEINYTESGTFSTDLSRLRSSTDGIMDQIHTMRTTYGADLVGLIIGTPTSLCGVGYGNSNATNYSNSSGFSVCLYSCVVSNFSLAHEFGHNMGLNHDWYVYSSVNPCAHHHGYTNRTAILNGTSSTAAQRWRTIMAYNDECTATGFNCTRINRWSNPDVLYNGEPTGIAIDQTNPANEAFGFRRFACVVSEFMPTVLSNNEFSKTYFSVYPNPMNDYIEIACEENISMITISNVLGQTVLTSNQKKINTGTIANGVYLLSVYDANNKIMGTKKLIKK